MPEKVKEAEIPKPDLIVRPKVSVLSEPKKTIALSVQQNPPAQNFREMPKRQSLYLVHM